LPFRQMPHRQREKRAHREASDTPFCLFSLRHKESATGGPTGSGFVLEHCAQKWAPVLRKNNATTQDLRAFCLSN
jgi:hypothetical protein